MAVLFNLLGAGACRRIHYAAIISAAAGLLLLTPDASYSQAAPAVRVMDSNGIDVISRSGRRVGPVISTAGIAVDKGGFRGIQYDNFHISYIASEDGSYFIRYGDRNIYPGVDGGHWGAAGYYTGDGELIGMDANKTSDGKGKYLPILGMASQIVKPDGEVLTFYYKSVNQVFSPTPKGSGYMFHNVFIYQPQAVVSSLGWMAKYEYTTGGTAQVPTLTPTKVYLINTSVDYCDPIAQSCTSSNSGSWPTFNYTNCSDILNNLYTCGATSGGYTTPLGVKKDVTMFTATSLSDPATVKIGGKTWKYIYTWGNATTPAGNAVNSFQATTYNPDGSSKKFYSDGAYVATTTYDNSFTIQDTIVVNGLPVSPQTASDIFNVQIGGGSTTIGQATKLTLDVYPSQPYMIVDELGRQTKYEYYSNNTVYNGDNRSIRRVISPEATYSGTTLTGGYTEYTYDSRRNITSISVFPKGGGSPLVTQYEYEASCTDTNYRICNKVKKVTDPKGNVTDFTYAEAHGGVLTETKPADADGVRPQVRYTYALRTPMVRTASNALVASTPVYRLIKTSTCVSAAVGNPASCVGTDKEIVTEYEYTHNNLLLTSKTVRAGNANVQQPYSASNLWQQTTYGYDLVGNTIWTDGPLPGDVDKTYTVYDVRRRPVFDIGIDPDGAGALRRLVVKHNYDADGNETLTQTGTGSTIVFSNGVPTNVSDFAVTSYTQNTYDTTTGLLVKTTVGQP